MPYKSFKLSDVYPRGAPYKVREESLPKPVVTRNRSPYVSVFTRNIPDRGYASSARRLTINIEYSVFYDLLGWTMGDRFTLRVEALPFDAAVMRIQRARRDSRYKLRPKVRIRGTAIELNIESIRLARFVPGNIISQHLPFKAENKSLILWLPPWLAE